MLQSSSFLSQPFHPNVANSIIATCDGNLHPVASCGLMNVKQIPRHRIYEVSVLNSVTSL